MKKILQPIHGFKSLAIAFLMSFSVLSTNAQNTPASFNSAEASTIDPIDNVSLSAYPNPASDEVKVVFNSSKYGVPYQARIINNAGAQLSIVEGTTLKGQNTIRIHVGNYATGVYYIQLLTSSGRETLKLMKQRL